MNIWEYENKNVKIVIKNGNTYNGYVLSILDTDDQDDAVEPELCIETKDGIFGIWESDIISIEFE